MLTSRKNLLAALSARLAQDTIGAGSLKALTEFTDSTPKIGRRTQPEQAKDKSIGIAVSHISPVSGTPGLIEAWLAVTSFAKHDATAMEIADRVHELVHGPSDETDRWFFDFSNSAVKVRAATRPIRGSVKYDETSKFFSDTVSFKATVQVTPT